MCHNWIVPEMAETRMCQIWGVPLKPRLVEANMCHNWIVPEMAETRMCQNWIVPEMAENWICQIWLKVQCATIGIYGLRQS